MPLTTNVAQQIGGALNDRSRTRIGDPWKGSYNVSVRCSTTAAAHELLAQLRSIGVEGQVNARPAAAEGRSSTALVAVYTHEALKTLLEATEPHLDQQQRERLSVLVRARGPIHPNMVGWILTFRKQLGWSDGRIAAELNKDRWASGMGGKGWTAKKIRTARLSAKTAPTA